MSRLERFFQSIANELQDQTKLTELREIWNRLDQCPILLQSGVRKGKVCGMACVNGKNTCFNHMSLHMCSHNKCMRKCKEEETQCDYHTELERKTREQSRKYPSIRWNDPFYTIHDTTIIIDVANNVIRGYKKDQTCVTEETEEIKKACETYHLRYVPHISHD